VKKCQVIFQPSGRRGEVPEGKTIIEASRELGAEIESICGGAKVCGKCRVRVDAGSLSPFTTEEAKYINEIEKAQGYRLSCAARILGDVLIFVPEESRAGKQVIRKAVTEKAIDLKPAITLCYVELPPPTFHDCLGDADRLKKALAEKHGLCSLDIDYPALLELPRVLRQGNWKVTAAVWMDEEIVGVRPGLWESAYGLAVDIGTTTVACYLCSLRTGRVIATGSMMNPQVTYGEDVMSRISYAVSHREDGLERMQRSIIEALNRLIRTTTEEASLSPREILEVTVVGNTAMHHLFLRIDPEYVGMAPFPPAIHQSVNVKARDLRLETHPCANVHILPIEAGFVGADNVGVLIAEEPYRQDDNVLIIDIGTNGELVMGSRKVLISSSCATGPALEGAHIKFGMRAAPGAVERIKIDPDTYEVSFKIIGRDNWHRAGDPAEAKGICGSGIIDAMAELYRTGIIDKTGRFGKTGVFPRLRLSEDRPEFVIAWKEETSIGKDIVITQQDVRNVQLAKGALYTGAKLMMKRLGIEKLDRIILAGAFGSYIDKESAMVLGMFPDCDLGNVHAVGNAAGDGARIALLNRDKRREADEIARTVEYIELTVEKDFQKEFLDAMYFPHGKDHFPHLKGIVKEEILKIGD
jgi:uncharacterized 2Fe-2S/4Fe-4S cluster protein (DUF4445 family)